MSSNPAPPGDLQTTVLETLCSREAGVSVYLASGIKLRGRLVGQDHYTVVLRDKFDQIIYKHTISTIMEGDGVTAAKKTPAPERRSGQTHRRRR